MRSYIYIPEVLVGRLSPLGGSIDRVLTPLLSVLVRHWRRRATSALEEEEDENCVVVDMYNSIYNLPIRTGHIQSMIKSHCLYLQNYVFLRFSFFHLSCSALSSI